MRFEYFPRESLPRLAWCARLRRSSEVVEVWHGPWVETTPGWFVEGAWTGAFRDGAFVEAIHLVGTGGRSEPDRVVFCAPSNLADRVHTVHAGDDLFVSNSAVFLLQMSADEPDPHYREYLSDRIRQQAAGIRDVDKRLPTARGRHILLHDFCTIAIRPDLSIGRLEKPPTPPPADYADYVGQLEETIADIQANAADPGRRRPYRPLATISRGYDSGPLAVLMSRHGAREAFTFTNVPDDDGTAIGERLGYKVTGYDALGYRRLPGAPEAEFHATPWGGDVVMAGCETQLAGALLITGRRGRPLDMISPAAPELYNPRPSALAGAMMNEFRLRVGFLQLIPYYVAALHPDAVFRISTSPEMKPWSVGGGYDKPIPRRILEEAGIPREWFGQQKLASARSPTMRLEDLSAEGAASFRAFLRTMPQTSWRRRVRREAGVLLNRIALGVHRGRRKLRAALGLRTRVPKRAWYPELPKRNASPEMDFAFHWAFSQIRDRYELEESR
jgi:hypothetical protein